MFAGDRRRAGGVAVARYIVDIDGPHYAGRQRRRFVAGWAHPARGLLAGTRLRSCGAAARKPTSRHQKGGMLAAGAERAEAWIVEIGSPRRVASLTLRGLS